MNILIRITLAASLLLAAGQAVSQGKEISGKKTARHANAEAGRNKRAEALEAAKTKRIEAKKDAESKRAAARNTAAAADEKRKENLSDKAEARIEARQSHQSKRIEHGINKGYLTADEISKLDAQQKSIEALQQSFMSDGKISKTEAKQLRTELDEASRCIFTEKHDAEGKTMAVYRLGKNITLKSEVAQKLEDENLAKSDARAFLTDFHRMGEIKKTLSTGTGSNPDRTSLQEEYNNLLNKYFDSK